MFLMSYHCAIKSHCAYLCIGYMASRGYSKRCIGFDREVKVINKDGRQSVFSVSICLSKLPLYSGPCIVRPPVVRLTCLM